MGRFHPPPAVLLAAAGAVLAGCAAPPPAVPDRPYPEEIAERWTGARPPGAPAAFDLHLDPLLMARRPINDDIIVMAALLPSTALDGAPVEPVTGTLAAAGDLWCATDRGLLRKTSPAARAAGEPAWRVYSSRRWLPDDRVTGLASDGLPGIWARTATGGAHIRFEERTLAAKAREFEERVRARHVRHGLVAPARLVRPGDLDSAVVRPDDNDGLWTAMYAAAESFRFAATGSEEARRFAGEARRALARLETVSGVPGLPARSIAEPGEPGTDDGEWRASPDGAWLWKGDASSDEVVGHFFAAGVYFDLVAGPAEREEIRGLVRAMMDRIIDGGWRLAGAGGKPTTWGIWSPAELNGDPRWRCERGLNSLEVLSFLAVAEHVTGDPRYRDAARRLIAEHGYAENAVREKVVEPPEEVNHSDDELAFLSWYGLLRYERDGGLRATYLRGLARSWAAEAPEANPLWTFIAAASGLAAAGAGEEGRPALEAAARTLRRTPRELIDWRVENSFRSDLARAPHRNRSGQEVAAAALHPAERPGLKYNSDPYALDGGSGGGEEDDGGFFLLAYWLARHHRLIGDGPRS